MFLSLLVFAFCSLAHGAVPEEFFRDLDAFRANSLSVRTQGAVAAAARQRAINRALHWTPELSLSVGKTRQEYQTADVTGSQFASLQDSSYAQLAASLNLFRGGAGVREAQAARLVRDAENALLQNEQLSVELTGARLLFARLYLREALEAQRELLHLQEQAVRIGHDRYKQGKIPLQEVTKLEVDLAQGRNDLRSAEVNVEENVANLKALFVDEFRTEQWPFLVGQELNLGDAPSPLLASYRLRAEAGKRREQAARGFYWPSLDFTLQVQRYPLSSLTSHSYSGALTFTVPLWSRWDTVATVAEARAQTVAAEDQAAVQEREESLRRDFLRKKIALYAQNVEEAKKNLERSEGLYQSVQRSFQLGRLDANDLQIEQNRRVNTILKLAESRRAYHESLVEACVVWGNPARVCFR